MSFFPSFRSNYGPFVLQHHCKEHEKNSTQINKSLTRNRQRRVIAQNKVNNRKEALQIQIRTVAAILAWIVVALLLLNGMIKSQLVIIAAIVLTVIAVLLYFSPRFIKNKKAPIKKTEPMKE
ncbi:MAG: hypothetical protein IAX21_01750 [Candidatus Bathyarchaeota archaeon]|nr:hypothetical protein [Candidatus Bathyarchaeum tardum]WGM90294.1 MAG: hypothetical protein NUK63_04015 [Candidatus Bathyarchaeum tardum]WNZ29618.1 MAG: hypothetical protein IAX21_01750 [Candidatus Bathyarchaeota archaeon]